MCRNAYGDLREILRGQFRPLTDRARLDASHLIGAMERGDFEQEAEIDRLKAERDRAVETRENANAVSVRVEGENGVLDRNYHHMRELRDAAVATLDRLEHLLSSPGDMSPDEIRAEGRRLIAETRGGSAEGTELERRGKALAKIADKAKYLSESAWTAEGCVLVGQQIYREATTALGTDEIQDGGS